ncbi:hypothetical protein CRM22_008709 [Opisthorchis felineus]|uniref:H15 domain-containing protein n=1 Tax=Opisthorchis felineus TaxID=147828 RepID=A0A4S2LAP3_OPIFE|nr:hypothetical protein CRM22_008709 [Opisthorchis felineus]
MAKSAKPREDRHQRREESQGLSIIKKFITANYKADVEKLIPHTRRGIVRAVEKGVLVRVDNNDKCASGGYKVTKKKADVAKPRPVKKPKAPKAKIPAAPKKPKAARKPAIEAEGSQETKEVQSIMAGRGVKVAKVSVLWKDD